MPRRTPRTRRLPLAVVACLLILAGAAVAAAVAQGRTSDDTIVAQQTVTDTIGDAGSGPDLSSMTVTTYADQSLEFDIHFANRGLLLAGETVQLFVDLNDDGTPDLNFSLWSSGSVSYLDRWNGTGWIDVRQLPEAVQADGDYSIRLPLATLRDAAAVPYGRAISVLAGSWTGDPTTGVLNPTADDWLPDSQVPIQQSLVATTTTTTTAPPTTTAPKPPSTTPKGPLPKLTLACVKHQLHATATPPKGQKIVFVTFSVNGNAKSTDTRSPFAAVFKGLHAPINVSAAVHFASRTLTVHKTYTRTC